MVNEQSTKYVGAFRRNVHQIFMGQRAAESNRYPCEGFADYKSAPSTGLSPSTKHA